MGFNSGFKGLKKFRYLKIHYCFQRSPHLFLFWARLIQYKPSQPVSLRVILILSFRLPIGLSSGLFPSGVRTAYFCALPNSTAVPSLLLPPHNTQSSDALSSDRHCMYTDQLYYVTVSANNRMLRCVQRCTSAPFCIGNFSDTAVQRIV